MKPSAFRWIAAIAQAARRCGLLALLWAGVAQAAPVQPAPFATVYRIDGEVTAMTLGQPPRRLAVGDPVFVNERVRSSGTGEAVLRTADAGLIAIRPGAEFFAEEFVAEGQPTDRSSLRLVVGGLRLISGWISQINRPADRVRTPTAILGVRGTDHEPYVLDAALSQNLEQPEGTYDKVNRGGTTLAINGNSLDIDPGQVGFASGKRPRALMTLLLPVLLDKVPAFYVPGRFDAELDALSADAAQAAGQQLAERQQSLRCEAPQVARAWLAQLDDALARRDAPAVLQLFAPDVVVKATVREADGRPRGLEFTPEEFTRSTLQAISALQDYRQQRLSIDAELLQAGSCDAIRVRSQVIERGRQGGQNYRFESTEAYLLRRQGKAWLAVEAETTQR